MKNGRELAKLMAVRGIRDEKVLAALAAVPRQLFVPEQLRRNAYADRALPIGSGQTISQPFMVATMLEALRLDGGRKTLGISFPIVGQCIVATHRVFNAIGLNVPGGGQDGSPSDAVRLHNAHTVRVVLLLPSVTFLEASSCQRPEVMMDIEDLHGVSCRVICRINSKSVLKGKANFTDV